MAAAEMFSPAMLAAIMSPNNAERRGGEAAYRRALKASTDAVVQGLLQCMPSGAQPDGVRIISAVLLRQLMDHTKQAWTRVSPQTRAATRAALLQLVFAEPQPVIANRIAHCVAQAASSSAVEAWPELLPTVCGAMAAGPGPARTALFVLEQLPDYAPELMQGNAMNLLPVYAGALEPSNDLKVRTSALKATGSLLMALDNDKERAPFTPLVQPTLAAISAALSGGHEGDAQEVLNSLVTVAQNAVDFFRKDLAAVVDAMLQIAAAGEQLDQQTCERALELLITLCQQSPARVRRCPSVLGIVQAAFHFMQALDDDDDETRDWMQGKYDDAIDDEEAYVFGDEAMERVLEALGKALLPTVLSCIPPHVADPDWRKRRAAMACVGAAASGAAKALKPHLAECTRALLGGLSDPHPRVKFAAIGALADLCLAFPGDFQKAHHAEAPNALAAVVADATQCPRVRGHACACVINFCDPAHCEAEQIEPYSDTVLQALCTCLGGAATAEVMEEALGAVTRVAQVAETDFKRYYASFMPGILGILASTSGADQQRLRGKAMQCVGIIGTAVGVDMFRNDAMTVLQALIPAMTCANGQYPEGYFEYYAPAAAQISHALKDQFAPFLPTVIPPLLHTLGLEPEVSITEVDGADEAGMGEPTYDEATGMQTAVVKVRGGQQMKISMNTTAIMEKQMAAKTFFEYMDALGVVMVDFIEPAAEKLMPLVIFKYSEEVRNSACFAVAKLFGAAVKAVTGPAPIRPPTFATQLLGPFVDTLLKGLKGEIHAEPRNCMSESLRDLLQACFESSGKQLQADGLPPVPSICLDSDTANQVAALLAQLATESCTRRQKKQMAFQSSEELEADDEERLEEELAEEEELMTNLVDCTGYLLKSLRAPGASVAVFDRHVAPLFKQFMTPAAPATLRHNAICLFDDIIEFGGATAAQRYLQGLVPVLVAGLDAEEPWERQACVYGIMQMAKHAPDSFAQLYATVTPKLIGLVNRPDAREDEHALVTENCISCLGAIARTPSAAPQESAQLLQLQLAKLPLRADEVEARLVHRQLCELVEAGHPAITGNDFEQLPQVLAVFAQILASVEELAVGADESLVDAATRDRIVALVRQFQTSLPGPRLQSAWSTLSEPMQSAVQQALQVGS